MPFPVPLKPEVLETQLRPSLEFQLQSLELAETLTLPVPPVAPKDLLVGEIENEPFAAEREKLILRPAIEPEPLFAAQEGVEEIVTETVPFPVPLVGLMLTQV